MCKCAKIKYDFYNMYYYDELFKIGPNTIDNNHQKL